MASLLHDPLHPASAGRGGDAVSPEDRDRLACDIYGQMIQMAFRVLTAFFVSMAIMLGIAAGARITKLLRGHAPTPTEAMAEVER